MPAVVNEAECTGCKSCEETCPTSAIAVNEASIAKVKDEECIDCNACADACSSQAITMG
jgi:Fe-S-cluster-containing hydrogenase component 2